MAPLIPTSLPTKHRAALQWFVDHAGRVSPWPDRLTDGTLLATRAKGIYKPEWSRYALSIRQTLGGKYPDRPPAIRPDGSWSYLYFQENDDIAQRDSEYTNVGLLNCMRDAVPVGVMIQVQENPARYRVWGLALVTRWDWGYFLFEGLTSVGVTENDMSVSLENSAAKVSEALFVVEGALKAAGTLEMDGADARERTLASIVQRRGQATFRTQLLDCYDGRCAITGADAQEALEAAHILPYRGPATNIPSNGILLRADIHTLFDLGLLSVEPEGRTVMVGDRLASTTYAGLHGHKLELPRQEGAHPNRTFLEMHMTWSGLGRDKLHR